MRRRGRLGGACCAVLVGLAAACSSASSHPGTHSIAPRPSLSAVEPSTAAAPTATAPTAATPTEHAPRGGHVVVVVEENHSGSDILGNPAAPYLNSLASSGVSLQQMYAIRHPSEPNYLALFSGSTHGLTSDACPVTFSGATIAGELLAAGLTFTGYAEGLPTAGSTVCSDGQYARKHVPWADYPSLPASVNQPMRAFPADYSALPSLSFVIPDLDHDMHDGTVAQADRWLQATLGGYATWAASHGSLLIVTWDEDDRSESNRIPTMVVGAGVRPHAVRSRTTLYSLLQLLADRFGVQRVGASATAPPIPLQ